MHRQHGPSHASSPDTPVELRKKKLARPCPKHSLLGYDHLPQKEESDRVYGKSDCGGLSPLIFGGYWSGPLAGTKSILPSAHGLVP